MIYKYYTADCVFIADRKSHQVGSCITRIHIWQSPRVAHDKLERIANNNSVQIVSFRRVK